MLSSFAYLLKCARNKTKVHIAIFSFESIKMTSNSARIKVKETLGGLLHFEWAQSDEVELFFAILSLVR